MKILTLLKQVGILLGVSLAGELLHHMIQLPFPGSIYGIVLLFLLLVTGVVRPESIRELSDALLQLMPLLFVPATVGIMEHWPMIRDSFFAYALIILSTTWLVMIVAGRVTQRLCARKGEKRHE